MGPSPRHPAMEARADRHARLQSRTWCFHRDGIGRVFRGVCDGRRRPQRVRDRTAGVVTFLSGGALRCPRRTCGRAIPVGREAPSSRSPRPEGGQLDQAAIFNPVSNSTNNFREGSVNTQTGEAGILPSVVTLTPPDRRHPPSPPPHTPCAGEHVASDR